MLFTRPTLLFLQQEDQTDGQRQASRRCVVEWRDLPRPQGCSGADRGMALSLQHHAPAQYAGLGATGARGQNVAALDVERMRSTIVCRLDGHNPYAKPPN